MANKFKFVPFDQHAEPSLENLEKLNRLRSLYYAHLDSGLPVKEFAEEFFRAVGKILMGSPSEHFDLTYVEFEKDLFDDFFAEDDDEEDDPQVFVHAILWSPSE